MLALGVLLLAVSGCGPTELAAVPDVLTGTWRTQTPGYEKSYLKLASNSFTLGADQRDIGSYAIERIELSARESGEQVYALHYTAEEGYPDKLVLTVDPAVPFRFVMGATAQVWKRDG